MPVVTSALQAHTAIQCRFRPLLIETEPQMCSGMTSVSGLKLPEELVTQGKLSAPLAHFLVELDRKLNVIISHLQKDTLQDDFPHTGFVTDLSPNEIALECKEPLAPGDYCEVVFILQAYPLQIASGICRITDVLAKAPVCHPQYSSFNAVFTRLREEDKEAIIHFIFQEERRRIRQQKNMD